MEDSSTTTLDTFTTSFEFDSDLFDAMNRLVSLFLDSAICTLERLSR